MISTIDDHIPRPLLMVSRHVYAFCPHPEARGPGGFDTSDWFFISNSREDLIEMATGDLDNRVSGEQCGNCGSWIDCGPEDGGAKAAGPDFDGPPGTVEYLRPAEYHVSDDARYVVCECGAAHPIRVLHENKVVF